MERAIQFVRYAGYLVFSLLLLNNAIAQPHHALIIGNKEYTQSPLINTENDAQDMVAALQELSYSVYGNQPHVNVNLEQMEKLVNEFGASLPTNAIALVYFSGHGVSVNRDNYLVPIGSNIQYESQVKYKAMSLSYLVSTLKSNNTKGLSIVLLDACRNNPFGRGLRTVTRGLSRPSTALLNGTFIGLSAGEGEVASDGTGRNGTYTKYLLNSLKNTPNTPIEQAHKAIAESVYLETLNTNYVQRPMYQSDFFGDFCFGGCNDRVELAPSNRYLRSDWGDSAKYFNGQASFSYVVGTNGQVKENRRILLGELAAKMELKVGWKNMSSIAGDKASSVQVQLVNDTGNSIVLLLARTNRGMLRIVTSGKGDTIAEQRVLKIESEKIQIQSEITLTFLKNQNGYTVSYSIAGGESGLVEDFKLSHLYVSNVYMKGDMIISSHIYSNY